MYELEVCNVQQRMLRTSGGSTQPLVAVLLYNSWDLPASVKGYVKFVHNSTVEA